MLKNKLNYRLINILLTLIITYLFYMIFIKTKTYLDKIVQVSFPFFIGFVLAYILYPVIKYLETKNINKNIAIIILTTSILLILIIILSLTLPIMYDQLILLTKNIIEIVVEFKNKYNIDITNISNIIMNNLNKIIFNIGNYLSDKTISVLNKSISIVTNIIIIFVSQIYFMNNMDNIRKKVKNILFKLGENKYNFIKKLDLEMTNYFKGLLILIIIQLFEYALIFKLINHPQWLILGIVASITTIVPYFGGYIVNVLAIITASTISVKLLIITIITCFIFSNIDGYVISPKIYDKTNKLDSLISIFMISLFSILFGFIGLIIAIPIYIIIKTSYNFFYSSIKDKIIFKRIL